ncbi:interleukin-27 receptor subunit alpha [Aquila chrysaetos chrysaetos]|uniref:interleukin-27 receptor subunit alpha n=1 Tax=Aquila chrysaetos chrysaetos TaxID=223781 RepID=UPI00117683FB|nr:interleukin-27 receptor subunit alpha [Aquila chrysaetos chrysaetos]
MGGGRGAPDAAAGGDGCGLCAGRHPRAALLPPEPPGGDELQLGGSPAPPRPPRPALPEPQDLQVNPSPPPLGALGCDPRAGRGGPPPPRCALRYRPHGHPTWTLVPEADLEPEGFEFEAGALEPGEAHEVQGRCAGEGGLWSDWSPPQAFTLPPHGLQEPLDVWRQEEESGGGQRGLILLWKDPSAGGSREYTVTVERDRGPPRRLHPPCCRCPLPPDTVSVAVTARGPPGPSAPARLRLDRTDLRPPRGVQVKPVPGPGLGVWWEPGGPPAAPQYLVEWAEVGAGRGLDWLRCPPGAHSTLLPGPLRPGARYRVRVHSLYPEGSGAAQATEAVAHLGAPPGPPPVRSRGHRCCRPPGPGPAPLDPPELGGPPCPPPEELLVTLVELSPEGTDMDPRPDTDTELDRATDMDRGTDTATEPLVPPVGSGVTRAATPREGPYRVWRAHNGAAGAGVPGAVSWRSDRGARREMKSRRHVIGRGPDEEWRLDVAGPDEEEAGPD